MESGTVSERGTEVNKAVGQRRRERALPGGGLGKGLCGVRKRGALETGRSAAWSSGKGGGRAKAQARSEETAAFVNLNERPK